MQISWGFLKFQVFCLFVCLSIQCPEATVWVESAKAVWPSMLESEDWCTFPGISSLQAICELLETQVKSFLSMITVDLKPNICQRCCLQAPALLLEGIHNENQLCTSGFLLSCSEYNAVVRTFHHSTLWLPSLLKSFSFWPA